MQIKAQQLAGQLQRGLSPVYLLAGDEPQQLGEAADLVRQAAKAQDYAVREVLNVDKNFDWSQLAGLAASTSLFADKKIIDLRLTGSTPGADGSKALAAYCQHPAEDALLLISTGKMAAKELKSAWAQAIDKAGVIIQIWPLNGTEFSQWLARQLLKRGMTAEPAALALLADRSEGNMLAAVQEVEKLYILYGESKLGAAEIYHAVADNSRYDAFKLVDAALVGKADKVLKIMASLQAEGLAPPVVLWALLREARILINLKSSRGDKEQLLRNKGVWGERKQLLELAAKRLGHHELNHSLVLGAQADRQIKGQQAGDPWETLLAIALKLAAVEALARAG